MVILDYRLVVDRFKIRPRIAERMAAEEQTKLVGTLFPGEDKTKENFIVLSSPRDTKKRKSGQAA